MKLSKAKMLAAVLLAIVGAGAVLWLYTGGNRPDLLERAQSKLWGCETAHVENELDDRCRSLDRDGLLDCQAEREAATTYPTYMWCERAR